MHQGTEKVRITAPVPGSCPMCATFHGNDEPHDLGSLYYQHKFHKIYRRFPTWADALWHCSAPVKAEWKEKLERSGIEVVFPEQDGA